MKNYLLETKESKYFILSYDIKDDVITVNLANGENYTLAYTKRNEEVIVSRMEKQASTLKKDSHVYDDKKIYIMRVVCALITAGVFICCPSFLGGLIVLIAITRAIEYAKKYKNEVKKNEEVEKMEYFLDNKDALNYVVENEEKAKELLSDKTLEKIDTELKNDKKPFSINNIDNYSPNELKRLKELVKEYYLNKDEKVAETSLAFQKKLK